MIPYTSNYLLGKIMQNEEKSVKISIKIHSVEKSVYSI